MIINIIIFMIINIIIVIIFKSLLTILSQTFNYINIASNQLHYSKPSRKEVIQAQIPLRLPCYDLAPIINFSLVPNVLREKSTFVTRRAVSTKLENLFTVA